MPQFTHVLLYFPTDKTFDIRKVSKTSIDLETAVHQQKSNPTNAMTCKCKYNGLEAERIIIQLGKDKKELNKTEEEIIFLKSKKQSIEKTLANTSIGRFWTAKKQRFQPHAVIFLCLLFT